MNPVLSEGERLFSDFKARLSRSKELLAEIAAARARLEPEPSLVYITVEWKSFSRGDTLEVQVRPARFSPLWTKLTPLTLRSINFDNLIVGVQILRNQKGIYSTIHVIRPMMDPESNNNNNNSNQIMPIENYVVQTFQNRLYCMFCNSPDANKLCSSCKATPYCSPACQRGDLARHVLMCPGIAALFPQDKKNNS